FSGFHAHRCGHVPCEEGGMLSSILRALGAASIVAVTVARCGGQIDSPPACPAQLPGTCSAGDVCASPVTDSCGNRVSVDCRCASDEWTCDAPPDCQNQCPAGGVSQGQSCSTEGASCTTNSGDKCGGPNPWRCVSHAWQCVITGC